MDRMTWIKPSFLWMMYRCGWAEKENQEYVLKIKIKRVAFDYLVKNAVLSNYSEYNESISHEIWKEKIKNSDIRCQWDPERDILGNPLNYRSVQIGIKKQAIYEYVNDWILSIEDITDYVKELKVKRMNQLNIDDLLPQEIVYKMNL